MSEALLIVNPSSGNEAARDYVDIVKEKLLREYDLVRVAYTEKKGDAVRFARKAAEAHLEAVFVMGGDGTVNEGISGLSEQPHRPTFSFIPFGTVNDLARALGISLNPEEAIAQLDRLKPKKLDIGKVNDRYFIDVVAVGAIPEAVHHVSPDQKTRLGALAYFLEGAKALNESKSYHFQMNIDEEPFSVESMLVLVALTNSVGGFEKMIPHAKTDDGMLHLIVVKGGKVLDKLSVIPKIFTGDAIHDERILYRPFHMGTIEALDVEEPLIANVDGDEGGFLPLTIKVLPQHLTVLVPE